MEITTLDPLAVKPEKSPAQKTLSDDFDDFLTMLTTQLKHQDPLDPLDSSEYTNQLVQFSQLEQQINQSGKFDDVIASMRSMEATAALSYIGSEIEMISPIIALAGGAASFAYELPPGAAETSISIFDEDGNLVRTFDGETEPGRHEVSWDGTDDQGVPMPDGTYSVLVAATDDKEVPLTNITVYARGIASGVVAESGTTYLRVGNIHVPLDRVVSVSTTGASQSTDQPAG
jgi:flagellar basal-body rod modification protein FlgD